MTKLIGIDCGHGLKTAGKQTLKGINGIIKEWTLNDHVRDYLVKELSDYDVAFVFTDGNEGNVDDDLVARFNKYMKAKVDVFISLHHNAFKSRWGKHTGVEVWVDRNHTAKDMELAKAIYKYLPSYTGLTGRGIKKEDWLVINQNTIPAVLVEGGFMDSEIDYPVITSAAGQKAYAKAVAKGLIDYLKLEKKKKAASSSAKVEPYSGYVKVIYGGTDKLAVHNKPSWNDSTISGYVDKGDVLTIVGRIKVSGVYMYKLKNGEYITSSKLYVEYMKTLPAAKKTTKKKTIKEGSKVKIKPKAKYGGLSSDRGKAIPDEYIGEKYTVVEIATHKSVKEALIKELYSWVAVSKCELVD